MIGLFKFILFIVDAILSIAIFALSIGAMKLDHLKFKSAEAGKIKDYKTYFNICVALSIILKFLYWFIIPDLGNTVSRMIVITIFACLAIDVAAFIFMLPIHRINKEKYAKCSIASSVCWIIRSTVTILLMCFVSYLISAPIIM